jgi:hypothetical protein
MQTLGKFLAAVCAILFVVSGVMALLLFNIERKAFSSETYKQAFERQNLYERMPAILATALSASIAESGNADALLRNFSTEDWEASIASLLPPEELKALADDILDSTFDYINGETDSAVVSLAPLKRQLTGASSIQAVTQLLRSQSDCTAEQLLQIAFGFLEGGGVLLCNPPAEMLGLMTPLIETQLQVMMTAFPDEVTLISSAQSGTPDDPRIGLNTARILMKFSPIFPLGFLIGMTLFAVRSFKDWLKWWGWSFTVTGGIGLFIALLGSSVVGFIIQLILLNQGSGFMPPVLLSTMRETVDAVARQILDPVTVEGSILLLLGAGMVVGTFFFARWGSKPSNSRL